MNNSMMLIRYKRPLQSVPLEGSQQTCSSLPHALWVSKLGQAKDFKALSFMKVGLPPQP